MVKRSLESQLFIQELKKQLPDNTYYLHDSHQQWTRPGEENFEFRSRFSNTIYHQSYCDKTKLIPLGELKKELKYNWMPKTVTDEKWYNENIEHRFFL